MFAPSAHDIWHFIWPFAQFFKTHEIRVFISLSAAWIAQDSTTRAFSDCHVQIRIPVPDQKEASSIVNKTIRQHPDRSSGDKQRCLENLEDLVKEMNISSDDSR